jgi:pimeloyl-ACP methyl ester carboxylesterase
MSLGYKSPGNDEALRTLTHATGTHPRIALGLLSGAYSTPEDLVREGFPEALERRGIAVRLAMVEVRAAYFSEGSVVQRIREAVVEPARVAGLRRIWLAGISLGALACLAHAARHGAEVERMALFSPYPGTRDVLREIEAAGGLERWRADAAPPDAERDAWRWLRDAGPRAMQVDCWFGSRDRFADGQRRMASRLPPHARHETAGAHEWRDWRAMWNDFLERYRP